MQSQKKYQENCKVFAQKKLLVWGTKRQKEKFSFPCLNLSLSDFGLLILPYIQFTRHPSAYIQVVGAKSPHRRRCNVKALGGLLFV